jgi:hypothetical protein
MISQKPLTNTTKSDKVDTMITQEMITVIDNAVEDFDIVFWSEAYGDVLDYLDKFDNGMELTDEETDWVLFVYDDIINR